MLMNDWPRTARTVSSPYFSLNSTARRWIAKTGAEMLALRGHTGPVFSAVFSPDGNRVVTASDDKTARVWDAKTGAELLPLKGHAGDVNSPSFSPDGSRVVTASSDLTARVWDAKAGAELLPLKGQIGTASGMAVIALSAVRVS